MISREELRLRKELAQAFRAHRRQLAEALFEALKEPDCAAGTLPESFAELGEWGRLHFSTAIELAAEWFRTPDKLREDLFSGWIFELKEPATRDGQAEMFRPGKVVEHAGARWAALLGSKISSRTAQALAQDLSRVIGRLSWPACRTLKVLFIGDCLQSELIAALAGPCGEAQIAVDSVYLHDGVQTVLRNQIRALEPGGFDLVFFSPFTHSFVPEYEQLLRWPAALWPRARFFNILDEMLEDVSLTVRTIAERFACPVYVHNTAAATQTFGLWAGPKIWLLTQANNLFSLRNRRDARQMIHRRISRCAADPALERRVRLLDEESLRRKAGSAALGKGLRRDELYHPTRLGMELAHGPYLEAIASAAFLAGKKVIVCDLDNTLWDGVIGEGPVTHFLDRQRTLKALRDRGVLLSINSKGDPDNVHFSGAAIQADDFVAPRINWQPKAINMASILEELNLKEKDCVFIDDRPDELERVRNAFPAMTILDSRRAAIWKWLSHWQTHLPADPREDRTKLYHERARREQFLADRRERTAVYEDEVAALSNLQLSVKLEVVSGGDLKRAVELINRTNQFNLCGSRTTRSEMEAGLGVDHCVITAAARDKFGSMGVVGVMRVDHKPEGLEIPVFVLSCRVFGLGIEYALLNAVKRLAHGSCRLTGLYRERQHNQPCREFYAGAGLAWDGTKWTGAVADLAPDPSWLSIQHCVAVERPPLLAAERSYLRAGE